ncbi:GLPGLI family protein [compost metagenome]
MKKIMIAFVGLLTFSAAAQAQKKTSGAIQFENTMDPAAMATANGMQLTEEMRARMPKAMKTNFELLFTATNASYMPVIENEDSNGGGGGGGMGRMMMRFGGAGGAREYYYTFAEQKLVEVFDLSDTTYVMPGKLTVANPPQNNFGGGQQRQGGNNGNNAPASQSAVQFLPGPPTLEVVKTDETKKILGFDCKKVIVKSIRKAKVLDMDKDIIDETAVWYTNDLGFNFSPNPNMWTEGAVLALENKGNSVIAKSIEFRGVSTKDVTAPKKAVPITQEEYQKKMENMMNRMRNMGNNRGGMGGARSIVIN